MNKCQTHSGVWVTARAWCLTWPLLSAVPHLASLGFTLYRLILILPPRSHRQGIQHGDSRTVLFLQQQLREVRRNVGPFPSRLSLSYLVLNFIQLLEDSNFPQSRVGF